jgi:hypothetical protein
MKQRSLAAPLAVSFLLVGCGEDLARQYTLNCQVSGAAMVENLFRSPKIDQSRKDEVLGEVVQMCFCSSEQVSASKEISQSEREAFYREGPNSKSLSSQSRAELKAIHKKCARRFVKILLSLRKNPAGSKK